ncbi:hypothetical protein OIV83_002197 [Microbotryomycetes sp. JL201]|nr:hypothetical protein OIV83_002197 [Microbotryomycetes sp. JL201]
MLYCILQSGTGRWTGRKGGTFVSRADLNPQQQAVLAAVPVSFRAASSFPPTLLELMFTPFGSIGDGNGSDLRLSNQAKAQISKFSRGHDDSYLDDGVIVVEDDEDDDQVEVSTPSGATKVAGAGTAGISAPTTEQVEAALQVAAESTAQPATATTADAMMSTGHMTAEGTPSATDTPAPSADQSRPTSSLAEVIAPSEQAAPASQSMVQDDQIASATTASQEATTQPRAQDKAPTAPDDDVPMQDSSEVTPSHVEAVKEAAPPMHEVPVEGVVPSDSPTQDSNPVAQSVEAPATVSEAVQDLRSVEQPEMLVGAGDTRDVIMGEKPAFVEDEVQVAEEATQGMVGMTEPELKEGQA